MQEKHNIKVNCVVPVAGSRMTETVLPAEMLKLLDPAHVTPLVAYLAHESSEHTGSCFEVGGGWYSQVNYLL
jgi:NAD(P)-dependent dehydrogenase (short-subunit alcohol dehydrogenase family)